MNPARELARLRGDTAFMLAVARDTQRRLEDLGRTGPQLAYADAVYYLELALHTWDFGRKTDELVARRCKRARQAHANRLDVVRAKGRRKLK